MARYIDADKLIQDRVSNDPVVIAANCEPTADVVEVVRCKYCKYYEIYELTNNGTDDRRYKPSFCTLSKHKRSPDWFCGDGDRRE